MRLLQKRDLDALKVKDRAMEAAEGLKLTKRVDNLREVAAQEEASLEKFRRETIVEVYSQITKQTNVRDKINLEVRKLEAKRHEAMIPLTAIKEKNTKDAEDNEKKRIGLGTWQSELNTRQIALHGRESEIEVQESRTKEAQGRTFNLLQEANDKKWEADSILKKADETARQIRNEASVKMSIVTSKEKSVIEREQGIIKRRQELDKKEADLFKRERLLRDKQETLLRSINRKK